MKSIEQTRLCVVDHGLFVHVAQCLAQKCDHVWYTGPGDDVMKKLEKGIIGRGFENITRVKSYLDVKGDCDGYIFPDIGFAAEQLDLAERGFPVWGHHGADRLEENKGLFLRTLEEIGMEVPPHIVVVGIDALKEHLRDRTDKYVKISTWRGDWETFHFRDWTLDEMNLDCHAYRLGPAKDIIMFYVFDAIDAAIEDGVDSWFVGGTWPQTVLHAMERKDKSLLGAMQPMADIHESVREANDKIGPVLEKYGYRGFFSTEVRPPYFIDPTCRCGSPPSQLQTELITNLPEVMWSGANGECLEPDFDDPIGAQVLVTTDKEKDEYLTFDMPKELRPFIKSAFAFELDGVLRIAPNPLENWAGWLVATGKTIKGVIQSLQERKALLPDGFDCDITSIAHLLGEMGEAKGAGIEITPEAIPEPAVVLDT